MVAVGWWKRGRRWAGAVAVGLGLLATHPAWAADRRTPVVDAVARAMPSVLIVEVEVERHSPFRLGATVASSQGTAVVFDPRGVLLTNAHVVEGARSVRVRTEEGESWEATVMALDADLDLAVLQVRGAPQLEPIAMGDSDDVLLGETVIAIGNPLGLGLTVSTGVVSSLRRELEVREGAHQSFLQTDAAINPGNSGGALVNVEGELIGINTAIRADAEGIGFAIPVNRAAKVAADLLYYGTVRAPWLGFDVTDVDNRRLSGTVLADGAVFVDRVWASSPADKAGLRAGDLVYRIDGRPVVSRADLNARLAERAPGDEVAVGFARGGQARELRVMSTDVPDIVVAGSMEDVLGITVTPGEGGLVVNTAEADGSWAKARLRPGDVILGADGQSLSSEAQLLQSIRRARAQHRASVLFTVQRGRYLGHMAVRV